MFIRLLFLPNFLYFRTSVVKKLRVFSGYFNTRSEPPSYPNPQQVAPRPPPTTGEEANTSDDNCDWNYICLIVLSTTNGTI